MALTDPYILVTPSVQDLVVDWLCIMENKFQNPRVYCNILILILNTLIHMWCAPHMYTR
jgi:hypothetical protein